MDNINTNNGVMNPKQNAIHRFRATLLNNAMRTKNDYG